MAVLPELWISEEEALLFAAAPDLLAACKAAVAFAEGGWREIHVFDVPKRQEEILEKMRVAIAKAEGREPSL